MKSRWFFLMGMLFFGSLSGVFGAVPCVLTPDPNQPSAPKCVDPPKSGYDRLIERAVQVFQDAGKASSLDMKTIFGTWKMIALSVVSGDPEIEKKNLVDVTGIRHPSSGAFREKLLLVDDLGGRTVQKIAMAHLIGFNFFGSTEPYQDLDIEVRTDPNTFYFSHLESFMVRMDDKGRWLPKPYFEPTGFFSSYRCRPFFKDASGSDVFFAWGSAVVKGPVLVCGESSFISVREYGGLSHAEQLEKVKPIRYKVYTVAN